MAYTLQQLSDFEDIRTIKHRYYRGIDTADLELLRSIFTDEVTIDYRGGGYRVQLQGRDNMLEFIANAFHSGFVAMHHGHMPDITLTGDDTAEGLWYLEDIAISLEAKTHTIGSAIYRDRYVREPDGWKISHSEYDRVIELTEPLSDAVTIGSHYLAKVGLRPEQRRDISQFLKWG
jgi:hypothetical protein